jgi:hypothetical protein
MSVPVGTHGFTLETFDAQNAGGNMLSKAVVPGVSVVGGVTTTVPVSLGGVISSILIGLSNTTPITGTSTNITVSVTAKDAGGNTIVGSDPYANQITLTDSDGSGATSLSTTSVISPSTAVSLTYDGATSLQSATISATSTGVAPAAITPATLSPVTVSSGGSEAIIVVPQGGVTDALVPTTGGLALVPIANGTTLQGIAKSKYLPADAKSVTTLSSAVSASTVGGQRTLAAQRHARRKTMSTIPGSINTVIAVSPQPDECSADYPNKVAYCINYGDNIVTKVDLAALNQIGSFTTDATAALTFSGGTCTICGIVYDSHDNGFIISTGSGYEVHKGSDGSLIKTIAENAGENFGYNAVTNQVLSPEYSYSGAPTRIALVDVNSGTSYLPMSAVADLSTPDAAAIDPITNIGIVPEEFSPLFHLVSLSGNTLTPGSGGAPGIFSAPVVDAPIDGNSLNFDLPSDIAVEATSHIAFNASEFGDHVGALQLPSSAAGSPAIQDYAYTTLPATPDGDGFAIPGDPHATATYNLSGKPLGLTFNSAGTFVAIIDLQKLLAAPRAANNAHMVDPSYDLIGNGVIAYSPI